LAQRTNGLQDGLASYPEHVAPQAKVAYAVREGRG
jgi:hypothetical protein